ncbi:hypothetical protein K0B04_00135 [Patescibacteria group bacterium]|nr:hypothetical protein [Patescibacteria group bacterium]
MDNIEKINLHDNLETLYVTKNEYSQIFKAGEPVVKEWESRFENYIGENQPKINWFFEKASILYGADRPSDMKVALIFNPNEGNIKGESIYNFSEINPYLEKIADVVYWVPEPDRDFDSYYVKALLHEAENRFFQGKYGTNHPEGFDSFIEEIEKDPEIVSLKHELFGDYSGYLEPTCELVTIYVEDLYDLAPFDEDLSDTAIKFVIDEETSFDILFSAMHHQDIDYPDSPTTKGPYANLRSGYRDFAGRVLNKPIDNKNRELVDESMGGAKEGEIKVSPYSFRGVLSSDLLEEYVTSGKKIDKEFVVSLYNLALEHVGRNNQ